MKTQNYKQQLASHIENRNAIKQMYLQKNIQMLQKTPQILSEIKEKSLDPLKQILNYTIKQELSKFGYQEFKYVGEGLQGFVIIAKEAQTNKRFAIKAFLVRGLDGTIDADKQNQLNQEKNMLQKCKGSPYVSNLIKIIEGQQFTYLILTECQGTLKELIDSLPGNKLNELSAIKYSKDIAEGLHYIHSKNCIVNDLKFDNILIDYNGNAVVSDFGFAQALPKTSGYSVQEYMGNFYFQAPECYDPYYFKEYSLEYQKINVQIQKNPSQRSEACSLGYMIYVMIQGFQGDLTFKKHQPLQYDQNFQSFKYKKQLRYIIDGLTQFVPRDRLQIDEILIFLKGIISLEFNLDQKYIELVSQETQEQSSQQYNEIEFIENFNNKYYPIFKNEGSVLQDLKSSEQEIDINVYCKNLESQVNSLKEFQVKAELKIKELEKINQELKANLAKQQSDTEKDQLLKDQQEYINDLQDRLKSSDQYIELILQQYNENKSLLIQLEEKFKKEKK